MLEKSETENEFLVLKNAKNMRKSLRSAIPCTAETGVWRLFVENYRLSGNSIKCN